MAGYGLYAAAKAALEALSISLAQEVGALGIRVTAVAPGAFRTAFLKEGSIRRTRTGIPTYEDTVGKGLAYMDEIAGKQIGDPPRHHRRRDGCGAAPAPFARLGRAQAHARQARRDHGGDRALGNHDHRNRLSPGKCKLTRLPGGRTRGMVPDYPQVRRATVRLDAAAGRKDRPENSGAFFAHRGGDALPS